MNWLGNITKRLFGRLAELSPSCKTVARLQSEALEHKLTLSQQWGLRIHLILCKWCNRYGKQIAFIQAVAQSHPDEVSVPVPEQLSEAARKRIQQKLRDHQKRAGVEM